jgi:hypothetical protein
MDIGCSLRAAIDEKEADHDGKSRMHGQELI